jgi:hypothetical protein|tara:strand:+ start:642 stop:782 length:141 start_codon:yes stop_codon:yes gene_type:complete
MKTFLPKQLVLVENGKVIRANFPFIDLRTLEDKIDNLKLRGYWCPS